MSKTILIMAGGTGGHIFPALAIAKALKAHSINVEWLGSKHGMENTLVPKTAVGLTLRKTRKVCKAASDREKGALISVNGLLPRSPTALTL